MAAVGNQPPAVQAANAEATVQPHPPAEEQTLARPAAEELAQMLVAELSPNKQEAASMDVSENLEVALVDVAVDNRDLEVSQKQTSGPARTPRSKASAAEELAELLVEAVAPAVADTQLLADAVEAQRLKVTSPQRTSFLRRHRAVTPRASQADEQAIVEVKADVDEQRCEVGRQSALAPYDPVMALRSKCNRLMPKKPPSSFTFFCQDPMQRELAKAVLQAMGLPVSLGQLTTQLTQMWKETGASGRRKYEAKHQQLQSEFLKKEKAWQATPEYVEFARAEKARQEADTPQKVRMDFVVFDMSDQLEQEAGRLSLSTRRRKVRDLEAITPLKPLPSTEDNLLVSSAYARRMSPTPPQPKRPRQGLWIKGRLCSRGRPRSVPASTPTPVLDEKVLAQAAACGLEDMFRNLATRDEVILSGKSPHAVLEALQTSGGLVNPAKRALLGR